MIPPQMEELHLINLGLEALPPSIGRLRRLRELCLGRNRLGLRPDALPWDLTQVRQGAWVCTRVILVRVCTCRRAGRRPNAPRRRARVVAALKRARWLAWLPAWPARSSFHPSTCSPTLQLTALRRLELQYNGFEGGPPPVVGELPLLEELNLGGNLWGAASPDLHAEYSQLG